MAKSAAVSYIKSGMPCGLLHKPIFYCDGLKVGLTLDVLK